MGKARKPTPAEQAEPQSISRVDNGPQTPPPSAVHDIRLGDVATIPIDSVQQDPANANTHPARNLDDIKASLKAFGQRRPIGLHKTEPIIVFGNGTWLAAKALGWTHIAAERTSLEGREATAYAIADNRTGETSEWNFPQLQSHLQELIEAGLPELAEAVGFDSKELDELANGLWDGRPFEPTPEVRQDEVPPVPTDPVTRPGDLWLLGTHRLLCGDSMSGEHVKRLMNGNQARLLFTSPPYDQQRDYGVAKGHIRDWRGLIRGVFDHVGSVMTADGQVLVNLGLIHRECEVVPYWDAWIVWMQKHGWRLFGWYVWNKGFSGRDEHGRLATAHEWVFHFNKRAIEAIKWIPCKNAGQVGTLPNHFSDRSGQHRSKDVCVVINSHRVASSVIEVNRGQGQEGNFPAAFPVAFASYFIASWPGLVYEPFAGSGTTLIAAEQLGRTCFAMELDPAYCDIAVARWEKLTGQKATLAT